ncbi:hypothetical protein, partial [Cedecea davisae]
IAGMAVGGILALKRSPVHPEAINRGMFDETRSARNSLNNPIMTWHEDIVNGKSIFSANRPIKYYDNFTPLSILAKRNSINNRPINIITGAHGTPGGGNWSISELDGSFVLHDQLRNAEGYSFNSALFSNLGEHGGDLAVLGDRIKIIDMRTLNAEGFGGIINDPTSHLIMTMCYGRNDAVLRSYAGLDIVQEFSSVSES